MLMIGLGWVGLSLVGLGYGTPLHETRVDWFRDDLSLCDYGNNIKLLTVTCGASVVPG